MKKVFHKNLVPLIVIFFLSLILFIFVDNDDFLYKDTIIKIKEIKTISVDSLTNNLGLEEKYYQQEIIGAITNGKDKGKSITVNYETAYSSIVTEKYRVGDKVFIKANSIDGLKRDNYILLMLVVLITSIYLVGRYRGLFSIVSVILNTILFYFGLELYFKGINLILIFMIEIILFTILSLLITSGKNKKTLSAIISVIISMFILSTIIGISILFTDYSGINFNEVNFLTVPVEDILFYEILIGGLGAIMDVSITMSSSISELIEKDKSISYKNLIRSGREIGNDIMSTMINVLFFTYLCSGLPLFVLAIRNGYSLYNYITVNFSLEMMRFLVGSIGLVLAIPTSLFIAIKILKSGDNNE